MNGREIERMLSWIEENSRQNTELLRSEIFDYMESHQQDVVAQLRKDAQARIPTSFGNITVKLSNLKKALAHA